jgi:hypothetical protein
LEHPAPVLAAGNRRYEMPSRESFRPGLWLSLPEAAILRKLVIKKPREILKDLEDWTLRANLFLGRSGG